MQHDNCTITFVIESESNANPKSFTSKFRCYFLIYYEKFTWIQEAIAREKEIKNLRRSLKFKLIRNANPNLEFLNERFTL